MIGRARSESVRPIPLSMARAPARSRPSRRIRLRCLGSRVMRTSPCKYLPERNDFQHHIGMKWECFQGFLYLFLGLASHHNPTTTLALSAEVKCLESALFSQHLYMSPLARDERSNF